MARVSIPEEQWLEFRALAVRKKRSVAAYLGHLVGNEISRDRRRAALREQSAASANSVALDSDHVAPEADN
jgi:hypothetical protein